MSTSSSGGPLAGLRVLELGHYVAAPFAARLLADLGAEVIKVEPLSGDPARDWGEKVNGRSLWWAMHGRNKRSIAVDLKQPLGREIVMGLAAKSDVVLENFRPGHMAKLGLSGETLRALRPDLIVAHISGYGQDGPYRDRPAFGVIGEAVGGLRYLTNKADASEPPVRVGVSIGDSIAGLYAAFGITAALWRRQRNADAAGLTVDVALSEAVLSMMEGLLPEYGGLGKIRQPVGSAIATAAPSNAYRTADGMWLIIAANSQPLFARLANLMGRPDLTRTEAFKDNPSRVANAAELDQLIAAWVSQYPLQGLLELLDREQIPNSKIYSAEDCATDPQFLARGMVRQVADPWLGQTLQAGVVPHFPECSDDIRWPGPDVGEHTAAILVGELGYDVDTVHALRRDGVILCSRGDEP